MSFDYDKIKAKEESHYFWTSYADLYTMLSVVFLFLYVSVSFRSGTQGASQGQQLKQMTKKNEELEQQLKVYTTLKDDYMQQQASDNEQEVYQKLMQKLTLLKDEAGEEKKNLRKQAKENEEKEFALNQYQQIIRNIIDANVLAKKQIVRRDTIIKVKDKTIAEKRQEIAQKQGQIANLNQEIEQKQSVIAANEAKIEQVNLQLDAQIKKLKMTQTKAKMTKAELAKRIAKLKEESAAKVSMLEAKNQEVESELNSAKSNLENTSTTLQKVAAEKSQLAGQLEETKEQYEQRLAATKGQFAEQVAAMRAEHEERMGRERAAFSAELAKKDLTAKERGEALARFKAHAAEQANALQGKINELGGQVQAMGSKVAQTEGQLAAANAGKLQAEAAREGAEKEKSRALASLQGVQKEKAELTGELAKAKMLAEARSNLAKQIKEGFAKAGIQAAVDEKTGHVTLTFGDDYFDSGSANLSPSMQQRLNKFIPSYSAGLFSDPKTASNIANVEIIGFASSTYKGKYVNPNSIKPEDQEAVNYNLKLSFARANAIFKHIFDTNKLQYAHQKQLLPLMKVVGQGYLPAGKSGGDIPPGMSEKEFCSKFNCKAAQKVIIKFNLKD